MSSYRIAVSDEKLVSLKIKLAQVRVDDIGICRCSQSVIADSTSSRSIG